MPSVSRVNAGPVQVLGLFPSFKAHEIGGIQESGRIAWEGITGAGVRSRLFSYTSDPMEGKSNATKLKAIAKALGERWSVGAVVVWHIGLLKLLPFFRVPNARVALFLHGVEVWKRHGWAVRRMLRRVGLFLSNSAHTWEHFISLNPEFAGCPHEVVQLGVGAPSSCPPLAPKEPPALLMIGRLMRGEDYKGHRELITVWPLVLRRHPEARLWIVGDGDLRADLEALAKSREVSHRVRFFGQVDGATKEKLLGQCRALALPSRGEGFGLAYLEAMRLGRPCLVGTEDAGAEVVNPPEAGLAADPHDSDGLTEAASFLLSGGKGWEEMSSRARRSYEERFTAAHFQKRLLKALFPV